MTLVRQVAEHMLRFQANEKFNYPILSELCDVHLDNKGDSFSQLRDTKWLERNILDYYASLWHAKWPHNPSDPDSYWGYIVPMGVTEVNIFIFYFVCSAQDYLSGLFSSSTLPTNGDPRPVHSFVQGRYEDDNPNAYKPVGFYSADSHYGVAKSFQVCDVPTFHEIGTHLYADDVPCENGDAGPGNIDVMALTKLVDFFSGKGHPIIIVINYGSTFKGACDDIKSVKEALLPVLKKNGMYKRSICHPQSHPLGRDFGFILMEHCAAPTCHS